MFRIARQQRLIARSLHHVSANLQPYRLPGFLPSKPLSQTTATFLRISRCFSSVPKSSNQAVAETEHLEESPSPELTKFSELAEHGIIHPTIINTIVNRMGIHTMTDVQRMTINQCLNGDDVVAQARTGTGKTLAFLIPIIQRLLRSKPELAQRGTRRNTRTSNQDIKALIISPTRELAEQIATEAKKMVAATDIQVQTAVGGTQKSLHMRMLQQRGCDILVGTPGRLKDILSDGYNGVRLDGIETFVLDEADRLLDIGFKADIEEIESFMPPQNTQQRQTLMFSATIPKSVVSLVRSSLRPDFKFVRTVDPDEAPTHHNVPQKVAFLRGLENQIPAIVEIASDAIEEHRADPSNAPPFKAIVYFASLNEVDLAHEWLLSLGAPAGMGQSRDSFAQHPLAPCHIIQMSSKLTQSQRTYNSKKFREAESAILISSDVTARGMDFPNVSHIIQVGLPKSADDYVHRLGRTGRAGKTGKGWLLLHEDERHEFRNRMYHSGIKIENDTTLNTTGLDMTKAAQLPARTAKLMQLIESGIRNVPFGSKARTYTSLLGVLQQQNPSRGKQHIVDMMNGLSRYGWGLERPPGVSPNLLSKLGFSRCKGLEIDNRPRLDDVDRRHGSSRGSHQNDPFDSRDPFMQGGDGGRGTFSRSSGDRGARDARGDRSYRGDRGDRGGRISGRRNDRFAREDPFAI